jgi:hypothetical protein
MPDKWIVKFQKEALPHIIKEFRPCRILIFGSRVKGNATEESDLDVILVSTAFEGLPFLKRMEKIIKLVRFPKHIDYLCYTPEEFERIKGSSSIVEDALEDCIEALK